MMFSPPRIAVFLAAIAIVVAAGAGSGAPTSAQTDPVVSVDAISDAANTATTVGPIDACAAIYNNGVKDGDETGVDTIDVDVVIQGVTNISGFQADLFYDPSVLEVTAVDYNFLLATHQRGRPRFRQHDSGYRRRLLHGGSHVLPGDGHRSRR